MIRPSNPRQVAFLTLREMSRRDAYPDVALDRALRQTELSRADRALATELVYGIVRRQRSLDALIDCLGTRQSHQQPPELRLILQIGLYQLRYLTQVPASAAVNTSVELAKSNGLKGLAGVVNGMLRQYSRLVQQAIDPLILPDDPVQRLGISYSFPDWIVSHWLEQFSEGETAQLCEWFNQSPPIDLRVNPLQATLEAVEIALAEAEIPTTRVPYLPQALRLKEGGRSIPQLPGYAEGWWTVQDSSAQLVTHLLDPQPGETIIDACAAPGGKTTHIAERMGDRGSIWACDRTASRLRKLQANCQRLQLHSIRLRIGDSRRFCDFAQLADRVLLDAPCSGLGTLHRKPDIRWRQTPDKLAELSQLQQELLAEVAAWVKPKGILVYATCTLNPRENERVIQTFLDAHPDWQIQPPPANFLAAPLAAACGWIKVLPHQHEMDGFFMVKLQKR